MPDPTLIRFNHRFIPQVRSGDKTATTRQNSKGNPSDILPVADENGVLQGFSIRLLSVERVLLGDVADYRYREEGFDHPDDFITAWREIYGTAFFATWVWFHRFEVVLEKAKN